ncbi:MAG: ribosome rescue protein RqcH [Thermoplasmatota archaeon]
MLKKSLSSLAVRRFVKEAKLVEGAFFQKAYQIDYDTLVLRFAVKRSLVEEREGAPAFRELLFQTVEDGSPVEEGVSIGEGGGGYIKFDLYFKMGGFLFISERVNREMPQAPSHFAMKLRKSLGNRILKSISQVEMDRLVVLAFNPSPGEESEWKLYLELFGDGNAILVKGETIEAPFTSRAWSSRIVKKGEIFSPPPSGADPFDLTRDGMRELMGGSREDLVRFLIKRCNLPPPYAEEICHRSGLDKRGALDGLTGEQFDLLYDTFRGILMEVEEGETVFVHVLEDQPNLVEPALLSTFFGDIDTVSARSRFSDGATGGKGTFFMETGSINEALETHMFEEEDLKDIQRETRKDKKVLKLRTMLASQLKAKEEREEESERSKRLGDALYIDYSRIDSLLQRFDPEAYLKAPSSFPDVISYRAGTGPRDGTIEVPIKTEKGEETVTLELSRDINGNADLLYTMSKTARKKLEGIETALGKTRKNLLEAESEETGSEGESSERKLRRFWFEAYRWCFSSEKVLLIGGRDAKTNERVVKKYMRDSDLYAHADISGAASVVMRIDKDQEAGEATKVQACHFSILHSKAWHAKVGSAGAYWVLPDQVSRTPQSGEFLAKGSFIIRGKKNFIEKLPLVGGVGTVYVEGVPKVMFGPREAVEEVCSGTYFIVRPGRSKKSDVAKMIARELGGELDQVMSVLPAGDMDVSRLER